MAVFDVIVIGGGISGLTFAYESARSGRSTLVVERARRLGGCLATHRGPGSYWFELGGHTCYNSYIGLAEMLDACGMRDEVIARGGNTLRFLVGDALVPGANLMALLRLVKWSELPLSLPRALTTKKTGQTVRSYYSKLAGRRNYANIVGPMMSALTSQDADGFPAEMLFRSRTQRRKDFPGSFTIRNGLQAIAERIAREPRIEVALGHAATRIEAHNDQFAIAIDGGARHVARVLAVATHPGAASELLRGAVPELATQVARVREAAVDTLGFAVRAERVRLPASMFLVPRNDMFHSVVTRDYHPDPDWRGFAFHYKPGHSRDDKLRRASELLGLAPSDLEEVVEQRSILPSPVPGHPDVIAGIDRLCAGRRLCVTGNWFAGLAIEDCVERSRQEWKRVAGL